VEWHKKTPNVEGIIFNFSSMANQKLPAGGPKDCEALQNSLLSQDEATRIYSLQQIVANGTDAAPVLDRVASMVLDHSRSYYERETACRALLSEKNSPSLSGIAIEGVARYLTFSKQTTISDTLKSSINFLMQKTDAELLMSPTVFAIAGLNPMFRDNSNEIGSFGYDLVKRLSGVKPGSSSLISQVRSYQTHGWESGINDIIQAFESSLQPELYIRARLISAARSLDSLEETSEASIRTRAEISLICQNVPHALVSQTMGSHVSGSLIDSPGKSVDWLTGHVGAATREQLIRIALQPLPIKALRLGFHHDSGTFGGIMDSPSSLDERLRQAKRDYFLAQEASEFPDTFEDYSNASSRASLINEFSNRESEIMKNATFDSTCVELIGAIASPAIRNVETLHIPDYLAPDMAPSSLPKLKRLEIFRPSKTPGVALNSIDGSLFESLASLQLIGSVSLRMIRKDSSLSNLKDIDLSNVDDCFNFSQLARNYSMTQLQDINLAGHPSKSSLNYILSVVSPRDFKFQWSDELCDAPATCPITATQLSIDSVNDACLSWIRQHSLPNLTRLELTNYSAGMSELIQVLDLFIPGQLSSLSITSPDKINNIDLVTQHPSLKNVSHLGLGIPGVIEIIDKLVLSPYKLSNLKSISFANQSARSMEGGDLSSVERSFFSSWLQHEFVQVRYPWPLSNSSILARISEASHQAGESEINISGAVRDMTGQKISGTPFIFWRDPSRLVNRLATTDRS
jgi:hypothetical protein